jgi:hypothetical protein
MPATFEGIFQDFINDPKSFHLEYTARYDAFQTQYQESHLSTIEDDVMVSTLEKGLGRCEAFVRARLVELGTIELGLDKFAPAVLREVVWQEVKSNVADWDSEDEFWQTIPTKTHDTPKHSDPQTTTPIDQVGSAQAQQSFLYSAYNDWFVRGTLSLLWIFLRFAARSIFALGLIYLTLFCFMSLIEGIPLVGPVIGLLLRISSNKFFNWMSLNWPQLWTIYIPSTVYSFYSIFLPRPTSVTDVGPVHIPLDSPFSSALHTTMNLSAIGLQMLSCAKLLDYSQSSLFGAAAIVQASEVYGRDELARNYGLLQNATDALATILKDYDLGVESQIKSLEINLDLTNQRLTELINEITYFTPSPVFTLISSLSVISSASCFSLPFFFPLTPVTAASCVLSFIISTQGSCYLHALKTQDTGFLDKNSPICTPLSWFNIGRLNEAERAVLQRQGDRIALEFLDSISIAEFHLKNLFQLSRDGIESAKRLEKLYNTVNELRYGGENHAKKELGMLDVKAEYTPGWIDKLTGTKSKGLSEQDKYYKVSLVAQLRNFDELGSAHKDAYGYFKSAELLLTNMADAFRDLNNAMVAFHARTGSPRNWAQITAEGKRLQPLINELKELGNYHSEQRRVVMRDWKSRRVFCRRTRRDDWEDCLFEGGL